MTARASSYLILTSATGLLTKILCREISSRIDPTDNLVPFDFTYSIRIGYETTGHGEERNDV